MLLLKLLLFLSSLSLIYYIDIFLAENSSIAIVIFLLRVPFLLALRYGNEVLVIEFDYSSISNSELIYFTKFLKGSNIRILLILPYKRINLSDIT